MRTAVKDFNKGVYRLISNGDKTFDLVLTHSLTGNKLGYDGMNCDLVLEEGIKCNSSERNCDLAKAIRKHKITRAIWYSHDGYVIPKEVLKNGFILFVCDM